MHHLQLACHADLEEEFFNFCDELMLKEVIIGERCRLRKADIINVLGEWADGAVVRKAQAADSGFEMVKKGEPA